MTSTDPPPTSTASAGCSVMGTLFLMPKKINRASSSPLMTRTLETRLFSDQIDKIAAVLGFAHGTGGHGDDAVVAFVLGERDQAADDAQTSGDGFVGQPLGLERAVPSRAMSLNRSRICR